MNPSSRALLAGGLLLAGLARVGAAPVPAGGAAQPRAPRLVFATYAYSPDYDRGDATVSSPEYKGAIAEMNQTLQAVAQETHHGRVGPGL